MQCVETVSKLWDMDFISVSIKISYPLDDGKALS